MNQLFNSATVTKDGWNVYLKRRSYTGFTSKVSQILVNAYPAGKAEREASGRIRVAESHR